VEIDHKSHPVPELAESWDPSPDAAQWTFKLRKGVEFHNGKTLEAEDVVFSINNHRGKDSKSAIMDFYLPIGETCWLLPNTCWATSGSRKSPPRQTNSISARFVAQNCFGSNRCQNQQELRHEHPVFYQMTQFLVQGIVLSTVLQGYCALYEPKPPLPKRSVSKNAVDWYVKEHI